MKRAYQVKVKGYAPFTMLLMEHGGGTPWQICSAIFNERLEWVK